MDKHLAQLLLNVLMRNMDYWDHPSKIDCHSQKIVKIATFDASGSAIR